MALLFLDYGTRRGWGVSVTPRLLFNPRKDPVPIVKETGWAPGPLWTGAENLAPTGISSRTVQPIASRYTTLLGPQGPYILLQKKIFNTYKGLQKCFFLNVHRWFMHNIKPTKMNYVNSKHWMGQKCLLLTNWSEEDEWGEGEEYWGQRLRQLLFFDGGWRSMRLNRWRGNWWGSR